jgi:hypothetical protein
MTHQPTFLTLKLCPRPSAAFSAKYKRRILEEANDCTERGQIELEDRGPGELEPQGPKGEHIPSVKEMMALSEIVHLLNERFGTLIPSKEGERFIAELQQRLATDQALVASVRVNPRDKARLTFDHVVNDRIQDMVDVSFRFYKLLNDDPAFAEFFQEMMFNRYLRMSQQQSGA